MKRKVLIGLGSNLGNRVATLHGAVERLGAELGDLCALSPLYETEPVLHPELPTFGQAHFLNGVGLFDSLLDPQAMLDLLLRIEAAFGRVRQAERPWGPRTLDLDLLAVDELVLLQPTLTLPHPRLHERNFVLRPLCDVCPEWRHPLLGRVASDLLTEEGRRMAPLFDSGAW